MAKNELKALIKLALCPGTFELTAHDEVCAICPHRGKPECSKLLRHEALQLLGNEIDATTKPQAMDLDERVTDMVHEIGIPAHIKGYRYVKHAIILCAQNPDLVNAITKELYPAIAKTFKTTGSRVERAIRHAIEVAWDRGDIDTLVKWFGYTVSNTKGKPTNSEFIALLSDRLSIEIAKQEVKPNA